MKTILIHILIITLFSFSAFSQEGAIKIIADSIGIKIQQDNGEISIDVSNYKETIIFVDSITFVEGFVPDEKILVLSDINTFNREGDIKLYPLFPKSNYSKKITTDYNYNNLNYTFYYFPETIYNVRFTDSIKDGILSIDKDLIIIKGQTIKVSFPVH